MGDVSLPVYSYKDQYSAVAPYLVTAPNVRREIVIGHVHLDMIVAVGGCKLIFYLSGTPY